MNSPAVCPSCNAKLGGFLSGNNLFSEDRSKLICEILEIDHHPMCTKCIGDNLSRAVSKANQNYPDLKEQVTHELEKMPATSIDTPPGWSFQTIGVVTAQATMGTGAVTEIVSSWTDLFGAQSRRHNEKLRQGEGLCFAQIRADCFDKGGNAIVGIDIDYAEVGGLKAMLMVCMTGTAIRLSNIESAYPEAYSALQRISDFQKQLSVLEAFKKEFDET